MTMSFRPVAALAIVLGFPLRGVAADSSAVQSMQLAREAVTAVEARDFASAVSKLEAAVELRPDIPQLHLDLAAALVSAERVEDGIAALDRFAKLGLHSPVHTAPEFLSLKPRKEFQAAV